MSAASSATPRVSASTSTRASRGWSGKREHAPPDGGRLAVAAEGAERASGARPPPGAPPQAGPRTSRRRASADARRARGASGRGRGGDLRHSCSGRVSRSASCRGEGTARAAYVRRAPRAESADARLIFSTRVWAAPTRGMRGHPREPAVDDRDDAVDRHRRLGHVGREDHFALRRGPDRAILLRSGRSPWSGTSSRSAWRAIAAHASRARRISAAPGQEDEHVAVEPLAHERSHGRRHLRLRAGDRRPPRVLDGDLEAPPSARSTGAPRYAARAGVQRRRHHDDARSGALRAADGEERERDVAVEVPLVELVEEHGRDASRAGSDEHAAA